MLEQKPSLIVHIRLRQANGQPAIGEYLWMEHLAEEAYSVPDQLTDEVGLCTWPVYPGLHELCMPDRTLKTLPILVMWGGGLAVPGMVAEGEAITYHLVLDDDHLAYDATPAAPRPTPVRFVKRQTYELMMPPHPSRPQAAADGLLMAEAMAADQPLTAFLANEQPPSIIHSPFMRLSTVWVLQPRPRPHTLEPGQAQTNSPVFFVKSLSQ
jgi:hypothetical protein